MPPVPPCQIGPVPSTPPSGQDNVDLGEFAQVFSDILRAAGMPITRLSAELARRGTPVSAASLSYWRNGVAVPARPTSLAALEQIEDFLGLPPRMLFEALPVPLRAE